MSDNTGIEWTDATWNPVTGCTEVSPGCDHCYAKTFAERFRGTSGHYFEHGFDVQLRPDKLDLPLRWRRPRRIFVNSMSDLFHDQVPDTYIAQVFAVMALAPQHTFQVLTKRHARMRALLRDDLYDLMVRQLAAEDSEIYDAFTNRAALQPERRITWPLPNVWLGVSTENQQWADIRIPALLDTPAAVRWISAEPLLGPIDIADELAGSWGAPRLDWVVVGVASRAVTPGLCTRTDWARSLRDQCTAAGVPFLFKQWGRMGTYRARRDHRKADRGHRA